MNRRDFLVRASMLTAAGGFIRSRSMAQASSNAPGAARPPTAAPGPVTPEFKALRRDVGYFTAQGGTIGWLVNKDALASVDTQFARTAPLFLNGLPGRAGRQLDVVINSHHHPDHTGGNGVMKPATKKIVAHANVPAAQRARAENDKKQDEQVYADTTFTDTWRTELGDEVLSLKYHGAAHTKGDIVTHFEKANVIHMGDLMFHHLYPVIDRGSGGRIKGWIDVLEKVAKTYPADAIYIFGHGHAKFGVSGKTADLLTFRDYLSALLDYTQKKIAAGESKEKIVALAKLPGYEEYDQAMRLPGNLSVAYDELKE
jgi:glyoxylase-like metal-dependent hydrolase (beta-lactamase superfamily II)